MAELDKLVVKIEADLKDLKRGMQDANKVVRKSSRGMSKGLASLGTSLNRLGTQTLKYGTVLAAVFGGIAIKRVISVGMQVENLQVQLKNLFGSAEEGAKAFQIMARYAGEVPFELEQIQKGAGVLAAVSKEAEDLNELLFITGNVASVTGLDFAKTAEQIQRSFSTGIASADLFREKAVKSLLGFSADAQATAEETAERFRKVFGKGGQFENASEEFSLTLTGTLSMLGDKMFFFQKAIADGFFQPFKAELNNLNNSLAKNMEKVTKYGQEIGENLAEGMQHVIRNADSYIIAIQTIGLALIAISIIPVVVFFTGLTGAIVLGTSAIITFRKEINAVGQKMPGLIGLLFRFANVQKEVSEDAFDIAKAYKIIGEVVPKSMGDIVEKTKQMKDDLAKLKKQIDDIFTGFGEVAKDAGENISDAFGDAIVKGKDFKEAMGDIMRDVASQVISLVTQILIINPLLEALTEYLEGVKKRMKEIADEQSNVGDGFLSSAINSMLGGAFPTGDSGGKTPNTAPSGPFSFKAQGGFVAPNTSYMVGERGPEMFTPRSAGEITPNGQGGITINQNVNFSTGIIPTVRAEVLGMLPMIKNQTLTAVQEARTRGGTFAKTFGA